MEFTAYDLIDMVDNKGYIVIAVNSTIIEQIAYDLLERTCVVTINNVDYTYFKVPFHSFYRFANSESKGSFYNSYVRGRW